MKRATIIPPPVVCGVDCALGFNSKYRIIKDVIVVYVIVTGWGKDYDTKIIFRDDVVSERVKVTPDNGNTIGIVGTIVVLDGIAIGRV